MNNIVVIKADCNSGLHKCPHCIICEVRSDAPNLSYIHMGALACVDDLLF